MKTLGEILSLSTDYLKKKGKERARRDAEDLLASALNMERIALYMHFERPLAEEELVGFRALLKRRAEGEPLIYILEKTPFFHCEFLITKDVLIPRPETEILLSKVVETLSPLELEGKCAWDICCGSGCLGVALKKRFPSLNVSLSDLCPKALGLAKQNGEKNSVEIALLHGDLLQPFSGQKADFVLCNPPYVSQTDYAALSPEVRNHEPQLALLGGVSGLEFYARLAQELPPYLNHDAKVFFEIGRGQGKEILSLFEHPHWRNGRVEKDWAGHDRFFFVEFE